MRDILSGIRSCRFLSSEMYSIRDSSVSIEQLEIYLLERRLSKDLVIFFLAIMIGLKDLPKANTLKTSWVKIIWRVFVV